MLHRKPRILVVGSFVMDVIATTEQIPGAGQTVYGKSFHMAPGGKGANQALQCARLGAEVTMVGCVGDDLFGQQLLEPLREAGMDVSHVVVRKGIHSGVGHVVLEVTEHSAQNRIVVIPGANRTLTVEEVAWIQQAVSGFDMVLLQLEVPIEVNRAAARFTSMGTSNCSRTISNPETACWIQATSSTVKVRLAPGITTMRFWALCSVTSNTTCPTPE